MADESKGDFIEGPDTPDLFEPNPLLNKFIYPMGDTDTVLSESCPAGSLARIKAREEYLCGYLNVKTLQLGPEKKSKDRTWHCYWAQVSDDQLVLYKVESISSHATSSHPPAERDCPSKHLMHEMERISLVKAVIGLEYTYKAEAKNRRRCLFRITQENGADYLLQAPSDGAAVCWVETLRTIAGRYANDAVDEDFIREIAIKRMREEKKIGKTMKGAAINTPILTKSASAAPPLDPAVIKMKIALQKKIDLLYHLKQMEKVFSNQVQPRTPSPEVVPQFLFADDDSTACCSSPSEASTGRNSSVFERKEATLLKDYYLIAGAAWSLLSKGEKVMVLQELRTGYYLVKATRNTIIRPNKLETKRNVSDGCLVNQANPSTSSGHYSEPTSPSNLDASTPTVSILISTESSNLVPSDSFQSTISDDSGIVESSKRASNLSTKEDEEDKGTNETGRPHLENGNGEVGFETTFRAYSTVSLPVNGGKLPTPPATGRLANSVSFSTISEHLGKDDVSLPLIGSVPPSVLDCYVDHLFSPTLIKPHSTNMTLQQPPSSKSPAIKKKKTVGKGSRLSLQVDSYSLEDQPLSAKQKYNTLPLNMSTANSPVGTPKSEKGKRLKNFFKKRLSTHGKLPLISPEGDSDKDYLSVHEESLPPDVDRVQSPVYEYTPITNSGQEFRRRGKSFVYTIGGSSSESDSDDESETSDKSGSSRSKRKHLDSSTPPSDKRLSVASNESSTKDDTMFEMSLDENNSPQQKPKATGSDQDLEESPEHSKTTDELMVPRNHTRTSLKKIKSLPSTIGKDGTEEEEEDKQAHRLSAGEFPSIEISMRAPPLNKKRRVYLDAKVQKFGFRLETYGRVSSSGDIVDTVVYTVTQGSAAFLAGMYPGDVIVEVEGVDVSDKNCNELGKIIASYKTTQQVICLTLKFIDGVRRLDLRRMEQKTLKNTDRYSTASSEGDSSDNDDKRLSGTPASPSTPGLGRISETAEDESMMGEETADDIVSSAQVVSPSQA